MIAKMVLLDWRAMKVYQKIVFAFLPLLFMAGFTASILAIPIGGMIASIVSAFPFSVEEKGDLNRLYLTLPIRKRDIVAGRFVLSWILFAGVVLYSLGIIIIAGHANPSFGYTSPISGTLLVTLIAVSYLIHAVFNLSLFPLMFRLGYQKGKFYGIPIQFLILYAIVLPFLFILGGYAELPKFLSFAAENMALVNGILITAATVILALSYFISVKVYSKRDF
jgi:hypothetical protein